MVAQRKFIRKSISRSCQVLIDGLVINGATVDLSASGCSIALDTDVDLVSKGVNEAILILPSPEINIVGLGIQINVAWVSGFLMGAEFEFKNIETKGFYYKLLKELNDR